MLKRKNKRANASCKQTASFDLQKLLDDLDVGVTVFHMDQEDTLIPIFCNEGFLRLSGLCKEQFQEMIMTDHVYGVHPDDMKGVREAFTRAYCDGCEIRHAMRAKGADGSYRWMMAYGAAYPAAQGGKDIYAIYTDADRDMRERELAALCYKKELEAIREAAAESLMMFRVNLTENRTQCVYRAVRVFSEVMLEGSWDDFIRTACVNVAYEEERQTLLHTFNREALLRAVEEGTFSFEQKLPLLLHDQRVLWCVMHMDCTKDPITGQIEGIMRLIDDDVAIRVGSDLAALLHSDYEYVAEVNAQTGLVTVISQTNDRGLQRTDIDDPSYENGLRQWMPKLLDEEFVDKAILDMNIDRVLVALEKQQRYTCTFPAKKSLLEQDGAFQWNYSYVDERKRDILFTRREVMSFLDPRHRLQDAQDTAQEHAPRKRRQILIADDAQINREMLKMIFEEEFSIIEAEDGEEAIQLIDAHHDTLALILLDLQMPKKTGLDVLIHLKMRNLNEYIPVVMVTGSMSKETNLRSLEYGISDIVTKPFDSMIVKRRAMNLIEQYAQKEDIGQQLEAWKQEALLLHMRTEKSNELLINMLSSVVEFRSIESGLHVNRVRELTETMLKTWTAIYPEDHFDKNTISCIARASALHDIGKVAIPDSILLKPGKLTAEEFETMKQHTLLGCEMLERFKDEDSDLYRYCYDICRYHHERSDGKGYPDGLTGDQIPIWAQIVSVVDVFDALISPRVYKEAYSPQEAMQMIRDGECGTFSPKLLACFEAASEQIITQSAEMARTYQ